MTHTVTNNLGILDTAKRKFKTVLNKEIENLIEGKAIKLAPTMIQMTITEEILTIEDRGDGRDPNDRGDGRDPNDRGDGRDPNDRGDGRDPRDRGDDRGRGYGYGDNRDGKKRGDDRGDG